MTNPVSGVVDFLDGEAGLSLTKGTNLWQGHPIGPNSAVPTDAVFVSPAGGPPPQRFMGLTSEIRYTLIAIHLRWSKFGAGNLKAQAIQKALQDAAISGYLDIEAMESLPTYIGQDDNGHHLFMSIVRVVYEEVA